MIKALAPRWSRGCWQVVLALVLGATWPLFALAQRGSGDQTNKGASKGADAKAKDEAPAKDETPAETPKGPAVGARGAEQKKQAAVDPTKVRKAEPVEIWKDPNAEAVLKKKDFREL